MFIKLTNAAQGRLGDPIWINTDHITAVYYQPNQPGGSLTTHVWGGHTGVEWIVEESAEEVIRKLENLKNNH